MLTVFTSNEGAMKFYQDRMKYGIDAISPSRQDFREHPYEILSKVIDPEIKAKQAAEARKRYGGAAEEETEAEAGGAVASEGGSGGATGVAAAAAAAATGAGE
jgi:hypothetical protein